jgi:hypothetical protein
MKADQRSALADRLARVLPGLDLADIEVLTAPGMRQDDGPGRHDSDRRLALLLEVRSLLDESPELQMALLDPRTREDRARLAELVARALADAEEDHVEVLAALVGGDAEPPPDRRPGTPRRWLDGFFSEGLLARSVAALWMNVLVLATVIVVMLTLWRAGGMPGPQEISVALLKLFALWCLSFLPGWLYVRFLGQRAGALWNEYVLHLHRLGWDEPQYLPRPPAGSAFFDEWCRSGGPQNSQRSNLYRQKFDAYYGRAVAEGVQRTNFAVRIDSMFPVFLATAVLAVGWSTVLWDPAFLTAPSSLWDMLRFAFLGAYAFIVQSLIRRYFQSDLRPSAYAAAVLRIALVLLVMTALYQVVLDQDEAVVAAVAFVVGIFPIIALQALQRVVATVLRVVVPQLTPDYPLNQIDGLNIWYESRLLEEGIEDMQNLATANLVDVILHTRVPVGRLIDWVDQAALYIHLDRVERGWGERRLVRQARRASALSARQSVLPETRGRRGQPPAPPAEPAAEPAAGADGERLQGSVNYAVRAGTKTRVALRQLGIRTATDLLKAFPPEQVDPTTAGPGTRPAFCDLLPAGLDDGQLRTLVRVLDEDPDLAPVWNWQSRGVRARDEIRRSRSARALGQRPRLPAPDGIPRPTVPAG